MLNRYNLETGVKLLYNWIEANTPIGYENDVLVSVNKDKRLRQSLDDFESDDKADSKDSDDEGINCTAQTYDLQAVYENYVLVHSQDDKTKSKYIPLITRISAWLDYTYG